MRLVDESLPVSAPFQAEFEPERAESLVLRRVAQVPASLEDPDIERQPEVVHRLSGTGIGDDHAGAGPPQRIERVLLMERAQPADDVDRDAIDGP